MSDKNTNSRRAFIRLAGILALTAPMAGCGMLGIGVTPGEDANPWPKDMLPKDYVAPGALVYPGGTVRFVADPNDPTIPYKIPETGEYMIEGYNFPARRVGLFGKSVVRVVYGAPQTLDSAVLARPYGMASSPAETERLTVMAWARNGVKIFTEITPDNETPDEKEQYIIPLDSEEAAIILAETQRALKENEEKIRTAKTLEVTLEMQQSFRSNTVFDKDYEQSTRPPLDKKTQARAATKTRQP